MKDWQVKLQLEAMAIMVEVEGMKVENELFKSRGWNIAYMENDFKLCSQRIQDLAKEMVNYE